MKTALPLMIGVGLALAGTVSANAQVDSRRPVKFEIRSQILSIALNDWAQQTGFNLIAPTSQVASQLVVPGISGELTARAALERLLAGTSLTYTLLDDRTVVIRERSKPSSVTTGWRKINDDSRQHAAFVDEGLQQNEQRVAQAEFGGRATAANTNTDKDSKQNIEEILVTAQRREERLQDVPISISVLGGVELDAFTGQGVAEALSAVPGVKMSQAYQGGAVQLSVRGVSNSDVISNSSSPVAYYIDSVPFGLVKSAIVPDINPYDLERVEVLRGPQGTLYGATALNGAVRVLTHDADLDEFQLKTRMSTSSTKDGGESYRGDLAINVPIITDKLAARAVVGYADMSGWIDNPVKKDINDAQLRNVRIKINAQPTDKLSIGLSAWRTSDDYGAAPTSDDHDFFPGSLPQASATDYDVFGLKIGYTFPGVSFSSMTSYIDYAHKDDVDFSYLLDDFGGVFGLGAFLTELNSKVFAQEINLHSTSARAWRWSAGAFYRDGKDLFYQRWPDVFPAPSDFDQSSKSYAVFGEVTRIFMDGMYELTGGLRYFEDEVSQNENTPFDGNTTRPLITDRAKFHHVSPRVVLTWHPTDQTSLYSSYSEGFRSGYGQDPQAKITAPQFPPVDPDELRNYEVGVKSNLFNRRVSLDAAMYYMDWRGAQQNLCVEYADNCVFVAVNSESMSGMGVDLAVTTRPADGLKLGASGSWNDLGMDAPVISYGSILYNKGDRMNGSIEYTAGVFGSYEFALGASGLRGEFSTSGSYVSARPNQLLNGTEILEKPGDELLTAELGFAIHSQRRWTALLYVDNLTNERASPVRGNFLEWYSTRLRPRTIGLQLEFRP
jgi:iron complex outermembrane recepter protein